MANNLTSLDKTSVDRIQLHVEDNSVIVDDIVDEIINPYVADLDKYVKFISDCLKDGV